MRAGQSERPGGLCPLLLNASARRDTLFPHCPHGLTKLAWEMREGVAVYRSRAGEYTSSAVPWHLLVQ